MRLGIDASNLRVGGGVTHLRQLLATADPPAAGLSSVGVWGGRTTLARLPARPWLVLHHEPALDGALPRRLAWQQWTLHRRAREAYDLVFVPGGSYPGRFRPFVTMSRNLLPFQDSERRRYGRSWMNVKFGMLRRRQTATLRQAAGVIFLNPYARQVIFDAVGPLAARAAVIPHGVDDALRMVPRTVRPLEACSSADPMRVLYVSKVEPYKHQWHVVDAVARLRAEGLPVCLDLIGSARPAEAARLQAAITAFDPDSSFITWHGAVDHRALPEHYRRADAFVFASSCENMPNVLLEAMAAGLPIACADRGPMPAMLGDMGVYFDPTEPGSIARALGTLARDAPTRAALAAGAFERAKAYSWSRCAEDTFGFLAAVHASAGAPRW